MRWIPALALLGMVGACAGKGDPGDGSASLGGRTFLSESVTEGRAPRALVEGTRIRLTFHDDGRLTASAGCNTLGGHVEVKGDRIEVGDLSTTEMGCDPSLHEQDEWLAGVLGAGPRFTLEESRLRLGTDDVAIALIDREMADPDRPIESTAWMLDGIIDGDAASSVPGEAGATLVFGDGQVGVRIEACNQGGAAVEIGRSHIIVEPLIMTKIACAEPAATVEAAVTGVLDGRITYEIDADSLTLTHPSGKGLVLRAQP
jgi:heat shock protein HslJ